MQKFSLNEMVKGWFVGNFSPTIINTNDVEVAIKRYNKNDYELSHHHKIATEITVIIEGYVEMNKIQYGPNDIIVIKPNESVEFKCLIDNTITCVVKFPGANNDKYIDS